MLLGLSLIIGGTDPLLVGLLPLFCLFKFTHINRDIESGHIARGQAELRSYIEVYEKTFNGTCFLSSPEQRAVVTIFKDHSHYIPWFTSLLFGVTHGAFETFIANWPWLIPIIADWGEIERIGRVGPRYRDAAKYPLLLRAISVAIVAWGFRDRLPTECHWFSCPLSLFVK